MSGAPRLAGAPNFRDFGGVPAPGGLVAAGRLFRAELLNQATDADLEILRGLGIKGVCDLRSAKERARHSNRWPDGCEVTPIGPIPGPGLQAVQPDVMRGRFFAGDFQAAEAEALLVAGYRQMPETLAPSLRAVFAFLLESGGAPVLVHCTSGKDRSGFMAAMLLSALGVGREAVFADYLLSRERTPQEPIRQMLRQNLGPDLPPARLELLLQVTIVQPTYLEAAFDELAQNYGGVDAYLREMAGLDDAARRQLQRLLLLA